MLKCGLKSTVSLLPYSFCSLFLLSKSARASGSTQIDPCRQRGGCQSLTLTVISASPREGGGGEGSGGGVDSEALHGLAWHLPGDPAPGHPCSFSPPPLLQQPTPPCPSAPPPCTSTPRAFPFPSLFTSAELYLSTLHTPPTSNTSCQPPSSPP